LHAGVPFPRSNSWQRPSFSQRGPECRQSPNGYKL
jgi:hypothetical protein